MRPGGLKFRTDTLQRTLELQSQKGAPACNAQVQSPKCYVYF